jgi:hypothetical protein
MFIPSYTMWRPHLYLNSRRKKWRFLLCRSTPTFDRTTFDRTTLDLKMFVDGNPWVNPIKQVTVLKIQTCNLFSFELDSYFTSVVNRFYLKFRFVSPDSFTSTSCRNLWFASLRVTIFGKNVKCKLQNRVNDGSQVALNPTEYI